MNQAFPFVEVEEDPPLKASSPEDRFAFFFSQKSASFPGVVVESNPFSASYFLPFPFSARDVNTFLF